jgi:hypothetical protein
VTEQEHSISSQFRGRHLESAHHIQANKTVLKFTKQELCMFANKSLLDTEQRQLRAPLPLQMEMKSKVGIYRLDCSDKWNSKSEGFGHACMT